MTYLFNNEVGFIPTAKDAFNRLKVAAPFTLFDSSHRYNDNGHWTTGTTGGGTAAFDADAGLMNLTLGTTSGAEVVRETKRVFSYQPGKSLFSMNTFTMSEGKAGLRQRVGHYGESNGFFLELEGGTLYVVKRSSSGGSVVDTRVAQADWNIDPLDGSGPSGKTLDITKSQIFWCDIEWLGVGTVRLGFVIDGVIIHCHSFHHANGITGTYMGTATLPLRYEIKNTDTQDESNTLKQICCTVISEGGYQLRGRQRSAGSAITSPKSLATAGTYYPVVSIRLKSDRLDGVVIPSALSVLPTTTGNFSWRLVNNGTTTGGTWGSVSDESIVEYNIGGTSFTGGTVLASGYISASNQASGQIDIPRDSLFRFQLQRDGLTSTPYELTLLVSAATDSEAVLGCMDWEEISR
jgi:hypothetical protein